jgi:aldehyde dehydrogenase (NAD+)
MGAQILASDAYYYAGMAETIHGYSVQSNAPGYTAYTRREAIGVVAAITPWNSPLGLLGWKLFPALAAGCTVVIKPSEVPLRHCCWLNWSSRLDFPTAW